MIALKSTVGNVYILESIGIIKQLSTFKNGNEIRIQVVLDNKHIPINDNPCTIDIDCEDSNEVRSTLDILFAHADNSNDITDIIYKCSGDLQVTTNNVVTGGTGLTGCDIGSGSSTTFIDMGNSGIKESDSEGPTFLKGLDNYHFNFSIVLDENIISSITTTPNFRQEFINGDDDIIWNMSADNDKVNMSISGTEFEIQLSSINIGVHKLIRTIRNELIKMFTEFNNAEVIILSNDSGNNRIIDLSPYSTKACLVLK